MRERLPLCVLASALALPAQVPQPPSARLEGVVVDPMQRPVPGAEVVVEVDGTAQARCRTDGEGVFVVGRLPQRVVVVRATTTAPDIGSTWVDLLGIDRGFARITLMPARMVSGTVRDRSGGAVAGAWVVSAPNDAIEFAHATCAVQADAQGRFALGHVPFGEVLLRAWAAGCDAGEAIVAGTADRQQDLVVESDGVDVQTFHLLEADAAQRAAARLVVTASRNGLPVPLPPPLRKLSVDEHGTAFVCGWPRGDVLEVHIALPGAVVTPPSHTTHQGVNDADWHFHVDAQQACIRGTLVANGQRVGGRTILVQPILAEGSLQRVVGRSAADGSFVLPSPVERGQSFALRLCDGDATVDGQYPDPCWYVARHDSVAHRVPIATAASITLRVQATDGGPSGGAEVQVFAAANNAREYPGLEEPLFAQGNMLARGVCDIQGELCIRGLQLGAGDRLCCLVLGADGWCEAVAEVPPNGAADFGTVHLQPGANLTCTIGDGNSGPLPGGRMQLRSNRTFVSTDRRLVAGRDGKLLVRGQLPGNYAAGPFGPDRMFLLPLTAGANAAVVQ